MNTDELREAYLSFFESKGCVRKPSDLLVPPNDPSVLFTPAGMNQFKEQFLGIGKLEYTRATTCQMCIRTGDIENVGRTPFHMTFFEMLGNFSFGDYFKTEAIHWAWEFLTKVLKLEKERLSITVYQDDDEAFGIWNKEIGVAANRITRMGEDDNFWPASAPSEGPDGVCGPCSEIFYDVEPGKTVEIWNLVFTQFNRVGFQKLEPLPSKNIDTGMGLERTASVLQGVKSVFETDIFKPIIAAASEILGEPYVIGSTHCHRIRRICEHLRTVTFCMHENVMPSEKKQGYVVRRLLRRAILDAYQMGIRSPILYQLPAAIIESMKPAYPDLVETMTRTENAIRIEENQFLEKVESGIATLETAFKKLRSAGGNTLSGEVAFELQSTHGFPIELTEEFSEAAGIVVDRARVDELVKGHIEISRPKDKVPVFTSGPLQKLKSTVAPTEFVGYQQTECPAKVVGLIVGSEIVDEMLEGGGEVAVMLDQTSFYGESGGQVGDTGVITSNGMTFEVTDTKKTDGYFQHIGKVTKGSLRVGMDVEAKVDAVRRAGIQRAHSATHVLHAALHQVLGEHAQQAGSKVEQDMLRFDFSHPQAVTAEELERIETIANEHVMDADPISAKVMPIAEARKLGAMALFGEKYGDEVRVISMGEFSREFCGGCHLDNTGKVGPLRVVREESVSAGTRRIVAVTGKAALEHIRQQEKLLAQAAAMVRAPVADLTSRIEALQKEVRELQKASKQRKDSQTADLLPQLLEKAIEAGAGKIIVAEIPGASIDGLREMSDRLRQKASPVAVLLASCENDKVQLVASVGNELIDAGLKAGDWIKATAEVVGGKGGGRPQMAQGGGTLPAELPKALETATTFATTKLGV